MCQCVVCLSAVATMQTFPCAHRVTCRRCFVRTIQTAISDRNLPLRCVVCRARILTLNEPQSVDDHADIVQSPTQRPSSAAGGWVVSVSEDGCPSSTKRVLDHSKNTDIEQELALRTKHVHSRRRKESTYNPGSFAGK